MEEKEDRLPEFEMPKVEPLGGVPEITESRFLEAMNRRSVRRAGPLEDSKRSRRAWFSIGVPVELHRDVLVICDAMGVTPSELVQHALQSYIHCMVPSGDMDERRIMAAAIARVELLSGGMNARMLTVLLPKGMTRDLLERAMMENRSIHNLAHDAFGMYLDGSVPLLVERLRAIKAMRDEAKKLRRKGDVEFTEHGDGLAGCGGGFGERGESVGSVAGRDAGGDAGVDADIGEAGSDGIGPSVLGGVHASGEVAEAKEEGVEE